MERGINLCNVTAFSSKVKQVNDGLDRKNRFKTVLCVLFAQTLLIHLTLAQEDSLNKTYLKGENATLNCKLDPISGRAASVSPTFTWYKHEGDKQILVATSVSNVSTISFSGPLSGRATFHPPVLSIRDLLVTDSGVYSCQVIGTSVLSSTTTLKINAIPTVSVEVSAFPTIDEEKNEYTAAKCRAAEGKPPARIVWVHTLTGQTQESSEALIPLTDGTFTIESRLKLRPGLLGRSPNTTDPVSSQDARKNFTCRVSHEEFKEGEDQTVIVPIDLLYSPVVTITVKSNRLTCNAFGNPSPTVTWTRPDGRTEVGKRSIYVDPKTPTKSSGRYVCVARSSIAPQALAAIDVQKSRDLPTLFTNTLRYNASLPVQARGYEMECTAEVESLDETILGSIRFEWSKDDRLIEEKLSQYLIQQFVEPVSKEKSLVTSVLRMNDVRRRRDEGLFKCRLSLPSIDSGYIRAVERSIHITVDYPPSPDSVVTSIHPHSTVLEYTDVTLSCSATSSPPSSYQWFFNGNYLSSSSKLLLHNVSREETGLYKCTAYNYVPGSASKEMNLKIKYPPGKVAIWKNSDNSLYCFAEGGSFPPPHYTWLLPNGTITSGNISELKIPTFDVSTATEYTCIASNGLDKTSNGTYEIAPLKSGGIGSLSVGEFIVTIIVCLLLFIIIAIATMWILRRNEWNTRRPGGTKTKKDTKSSILLQYSEPPYGGSIGSMAFNRRSSDTACVDFMENISNGANENKPAIKYSASASIPNGKSSVMSPKMEGKPALMNYVNLASKSNLRSKENGLDTIDGISKYRSIDELDGSGVEILENSSMHSSILGREKEGNSRPFNQNYGQKPPVKLTTFSSPTRLNEESGKPSNHVVMARDTDRDKLEQTRPLSRAFSETFAPVLYDDTARPAKHHEQEMSKQNGEGGINMIPKYATLNDRKLLTSRPEAASPCSEFGGMKYEKPSSRSSSRSSSSRRMSDDHQHPNVPPAYQHTVPRQLNINEAALTKQQPFIPGYRYNAVDPYNTYHPDRDYRPTPTQTPRCQSVEPGYDHDYPPSMPDLPIRNYLYHPYIETRLGVPISAQQTLPKKGGSTVTSPYDSGSDSTKSSATATTVGGRRMQSLTLV